MPNAIYLLITSPNTSTSTGGLPETRMSAYLVDLLEGETEADAVRRFVTPEMLGCELVALDAAAGTTYRVSPDVSPAQVEEGS